MIPKRPLWEHVVQALGYTLIIMGPTYVIASAIGSTEPGAPVCECEQPPVPCLGGNDHYCCLDPEHHFTGPLKSEERAQ